MRTQTAARPIRDLVSEFNAGQILLPQFQRDYVWKPRKICNLLDSLVNELPIGGFYLWRPTGNALDPRPKAFGGNNKISQFFSGYLIDGQQRLTSLEAAFGLFSGQDKRGDLLRSYLDLGATDLKAKRVTRLFVTFAGNKTVARRVNRCDPSLVPLSELFSGQNQDMRRKTQDSLKESGWSSKRLDKAMKVFDQACRMLDQLLSLA